MQGVVICKYIALLNNVVDPLDIRYAGTISYLFCSTCRQTKKGRKSDDWLQTQQPWVDAWQTATDSILQEAQPYDAGTYDTYLEWYVRNTRTRLTGAPPPRHADPSHAERLDLGMDPYRAARQDDSVR